MTKIINAAIQVLPNSNKKHPYDIVDKAIEEIIKSGLKYKVCPFETVVEGELNVVLALIEKIHQVCYNNDTETMMTYIKIQSAKDKNVSIDDKMNKYQ